MISKFIRCTLVLVLFLIDSASSKAQELDITFKISVPNNSIADPKTFSLLEQEISEFINKTKWTEKSFEANEKIKGNIQMTITNVVSANTFVADVIVQTSRPVYNSVYQTRTINFIDKGLSFIYNIGQPIQRSEQSYYDNLSSSLTYYIYAILAVDFDSYSLYGGDKYWQITRDIISSLPQSLANNDPTWSKSSTYSKNKFGITDSMLNPRVRPFRQAFYEYHRLGLDLMWQDSDKQRAVIAGAISMFEEVNQSFPNCGALQLFADSKRDEIVEIFKVGDKGQKLKIANIMLAFDAGQANVYESLKR